MRQFVLMNKETGDLGVGVRCIIVDDSVIEQELASISGYSVQLRKRDEFDGWLVVAADGQPYLYAPKDMVEAKVEVLGEL